MWPGLRAMNWGGHFLKYSVDVVKNYENYDSVEKDKDQLLDEIDSAAKRLDEIIRKLIADIDEIDKPGEI